jgi:AcrR family transcriptional regulator
MPVIKPPSPPSRREAKRDSVLDAAERLLRRSGTAEFSMRELAVEAGVSFATPFNYFGSKTAITHALSARRIDVMEARFAASRSASDVVSRVLMAVAIAVDVLLEEPAVSRPVIGSLGSPTTEPGHVADRSRALWAMAITDLIGVRADLAMIAERSLPDFLALGFRGCLSFWAAGEIGDAELHSRARAMAAALLLGFADPKHHELLTQRLLK